MIYPWLFAVALVVLILRIFHVGEEKGLLTTWIVIAGACVLFGLLDFFQSGGFSGL